MTAEVVLTPLGQLGTPEQLKPIIGAKVVYKFTNAGPGANLVIGPGFNLDPQSVLFDPAPGAVNVVTMFYDGTEFWACLSTANPIPIPVPSAGSITRIGDFGWGEGIIVVNTCPVEIGLIDVGGTPTAQFSAFDIISSIHYTGTDNLIFTVNDFSNPGVPSTNADPRLAVYQFGCAEVGIQVASIVVAEESGPLQSEVVQALVQVDDQGGLCNP